MAFMEPEIYKGHGYSVELQDGSRYFVPADILEGRASKKELDQYRPESSGFSPVIGYTKERGYFAHLTAPGYLDQTDWEYFATKKELDEWVAEQEEDEGGDDDDDDATANPRRHVRRPMGVPKRFAKPFHVTKWEERDRLHIALLDSNDETIIEWWDDEAREAFEDGFLDARHLQRSAEEYATHMGLL